MAVYDRWHTAKPRTGPGGAPVAPCGPRCGKGVRYPSADHGVTARWQVRYRDDAGRQRKRNYTRKPEADAYDMSVSHELATGEYVDRNAGKIKLADYGRAWLADQPFHNPSTREATELRLRLHVFDDEIGGKELRHITPSTIRAWVTRKLATLAPSTAQTVYANLSGLLSAAVDDGRIPRSPMKADTARKARPKTPSRKVVPWPVERVAAVRAALPVRYAATVDGGGGLGMRQGEVFGLAVDDVDFLGRIVHVRRQVKIVKGRMVFALPKGSRERDVPLPESVALRWSAHIAACPPLDVALPWDNPDGRQVTARLIFTSRERKAVNRNYFNTFIWKPTLEAAGVIPKPRPGERRDAAVTRVNGFHALRHHFASVALANGVDVRALAEYLGHSDPGFTLRTYAHLMPDAADRMRRAIDRALSGRPVNGPSIAESRADVP